MSNVVLEAKACGLPVAGFSIPGNNELLEKNRDIKVDKENYTALNYEICKMSKKRYLRKGKVSESFEKLFNMKNISDQFLYLICQVAESNNSVIR